MYDTVTHQWYIISCPRNCAPPACSGSINGPSFVCAGDTVSYNITSCNANTYNWNIPTGWTIISGQGTASITVIPDTSDGIISVSVCNQCGCTSTTPLTVTADSCPSFCLAIGGPNVEYGFDIEQTPDGGFVIVGQTNSTFSTSNIDVYIAKIDAAGNLQWTRTVGGLNDDYGYSIATTADGGYIVAGYTTSFGQGNNDIYLIKLDASGNLQWTRTVGGIGDDYAYSVVQTTDGGYAVAGYTNSFGPGASYAYIAKLDGSGNLQWTKAIGGLNYDFGYRIIQTSDGGYAVVGNTEDGPGGRAVYVIKLDSSGNLLWTKIIGGAGWDLGYDIIQTSDGGYAITGHTSPFGQGSADVYVIKLDPLGNIQWTRTIGGTNIDHGYSIIQTSDGGYLIAGRTNSFGYGSYDVYLVKLDASGNLQWTKTIGSTGWEEANSIIKTLDGGYAIAGRTSSFGQGSYDMYVVKLDKNGNIQNCTTGCLIDTGGATASGGTSTSGGTTYSGGTTASGGTTSSGGSVTKACP